MVLDLRGKNFIGVFLVLLLVTYIWCRVNKKEYYKNWTLYMFIFYILCVVKLAFFPIYFNLDGSLSEHASVRAENKIYLQLIPLKSIKSILNNPFWFVQIVGNTVFLLPLPIFVGVLNYKRNIKSLNLILIGISFSLIIELIQYILNAVTKFPNRVTDIDDLILNSIGVIIGVYIFKKLKRWKLINVLLPQ